MIHPTAIIHSSANIDPSAEIGPYCVIDGGVQLGPDCRLSPYVHLTGRTLIGRGNVFHSGSVIGDAPQDLKYKGEPTGLRIGDGNTFREHVTIHRSNQPTEETVIGSHNFFMAHSHVGHNSHIGNHVILANAALLAGHVTVEDRAFISGTCLVHQFTRVGRVALMQGGAGIGKDLPPFTIARGVNGLCGLNVVGMRRAGYTTEERREIKRLYLKLFRSDLPFTKALAAAQQEFTSPVTRIILDFVTASKRGVCVDVGRKPMGE